MTLGDGLVVAYGDPEHFAPVARWFRRQLESATGWEILLAPIGEPDPEERPVRDGTVRAGAVAIVELQAEPLAREAYELTVADGRVAVRAGGPAGAYYGLQTLRQLLPDSFYRAASGERASGAKGAPVEITAIEVEDRPRYTWRGVHLDVARHFMPKHFLLRLIDLAAMHKCNVLHLHLTDDQGWRVPIDRYPRLVEVGAWRRESPAGHAYERRGDDTPHGGFYSKDDLREIVGYAAENQMTVLPEVDMPGHMLAAITAYPELGSGEHPVEVLTRWGISPHVLNLEEATVQFCKDVIDELVEIFPGERVHIGGDECPTAEWESSLRAEELMAEHHLGAPRELQGWFTARMAEHLASHGRSLVGWDEIQEGGAPDGAVVMSWRGEAGGVAAALAGHDVVMTPEEWCYFDWSYCDGPAEPLAIRPAISVERVYGYDPSAAVPEGGRHHVLGAQCNLWTEYVSTPEHAEYMYFPRLCALAEVVWSEGERSYTEFERRLDSHLGRLAALGVNYRPLGGPTPGQARTWLDPATATP